jgi:hypothetical protein
MKNATDIIDKRVRTKEHLELHFFDEVYRVYVVYIICPRDRLKPLLREYGYKKDLVDELGDSASGYCIQLNEETSMVKGQNCYIVWQQERHFPCLVHELTHLTMSVFDYHDIPLRIENQEVFCYYIEHWVKRIIEVWRVPREKKADRSDPKQLAIGDRIG